MEGISPVDLNSLPDEPGIYKMLDSRGGLLYVGKAKNIKKRVKSYFRRPETLDSKTIQLVKSISFIDTIVVRSESEALILEAQLIKEFQPRYNILLKDDKSFPYVKISNEIFPRLLIVRDRVNDGASYFGPYPSIGSIKYLKRMLNDMYRLRDCSIDISLDSPQPKCIKLDMNRCLGPCVFKNVHSQYLNAIGDLKQLLSGRNKELVSKMSTEMAQLAREKRFELAAELRDRIRKIEQLGQRQTVVLSENGCFQVWSSADQNGFLYVIVQTFIDGKLLFQNGFYFENPTENVWDDGLVQTFISVIDEKIPVKLICDPWIEPIILAVRSSLQLKFEVSVPKRGNKLVLLETARHNARLSISRIIRDRSVNLRPRVEADIVVVLQKKLDLGKKPVRIIGVDISHLHGTDIVGSAVCFQNGNPLKSAYRKLMVRSVSGDSNDPKSIYEVVSRRLQLCFADHEPLPDLMLIDGGVGQLNFAYRALLELGLQDEIELISLAKRKEEIFRVGRSEPIVLSPDDNVLKLLQWIRDESHRFALEFQRKRRKVANETTVLQTIPGLGPKRIQRIYQAFKSIDRLLSASDAEIALAAGISIGLVYSIRERLSQTKMFL
ncbi:excinuclease ABC subunit UvrC [bacterium]|nr:excinuclease ABC subunit UvrC [bacterium]